MRLVFHRHSWGKAHLVALNLIRGVTGEGWGLPSISACIRMSLVVVEEENEHVVNIFFKDHDILQLLLSKDGRPPSPPLPLPHPDQGLVCDLLGQGDSRKHDKAEA